MQRSAIFSVGLIVAALPFALPSAAEDGLQLLRKMQSALGGAENIASVMDFEEVQKAASWTRDGKLIGSVVKRTRWIRPDILRVDQEGPGDTYVLYFDGTAGWEILPTKAERKIISLTGGELDFARKYLRNFDLKIWLADRDSTYEVSSPAESVLRITDREDPTRPVEITLDASTGLPLKRSTVSLADPAHPVPSETRFDDWRTFQGIRFPGRTIVFQNGVRAAEGTIESLALNRGLKPGDLAAKPIDLKPALTQ